MTDPCGTPQYMLKHSDWTPLLLDYIIKIQFKIQ